jgi:ABC-2 type transport system ATP-binding protein
LLAALRSDIPVPMDQTEHRRDAVHARGLVKHYGEETVVKGVDVSIAEGTIYGILGPNGAGKSTTIRMLLGIVEPDGGSRRILGAANPRAVAYRVGYLPEERGTYQAMKARESIAFMGALRGLPWKEGRRRADEMMTRFGLGHATARRISKLSKGQAQLVQLLGAIVHRPEMLFLDEPFSGLDPVNQQVMESIVLAEKARGTTIVFSTHVMAHAERMCDRIMVIAKGEVRFEGTVREARSRLSPVIRYTPRIQAGIEASIPAEAERHGDEWRFQTSESVESVLARIMSSGNGVLAMTMEQPSLHDAFVDIVGEQLEPETVT